MNKKVSIIVPCYNREKYIRECVDSLLMQTFPIDDMELIFVDDASTDATVDILKEYEQVWSENIIVITNEKNSGTAGAMRNIGMQYANGECLIFVDSDDRIDAETVAYLYDLLTKNNADIAAVSYEMFDANGNTVWGVIHPDYVYHLNVISDFQQILGSDTAKNGTVCGKIFRKIFLEEKGMHFAEDLRFAEDQLFTVQSIFSAATYCTASKVMYHYRSNPNGIMQSKKSLDYIMDVFEVQERLYPLYLSRWNAINEIVEGHFYLAAWIVRRRYMTFAPEKYPGRLEYMKNRMQVLVPNAKNNRFILGQRGAEAEAIYAELFGD